MCLQQKGLLFLQMWKKIKGLNTKIQDSFYFGMSFFPFFFFLFFFKGGAVAEHQNFHLLSLYSAQVNHWNRACKTAIIAKNHQGDLGSHTERRIILVLTELEAEPSLLFSWLQKTWYRKHRWMWHGLCSTFKHETPPPPNTSQNTWRMILTMKEPKGGIAEHSRCLPCTSLKALS